MTNENKIVGVICLVFFIIIGLLFWKGPNLNTATVIKNASLLTKESSRMTGKLGAKITVVEFGDYQCPACAVVNVEIKKVIETYKNNPDFNFVFRNFPLPQHKNAIAAAEAAEAAGAQGKYFEMGTLLYENQKEWAKNAEPLPVFIKYAESLGLNTDKFNADLEERKFLPAIEADALDARALVLDHTPTVFINGLEQKDLSYEGMKTKIESLLNNKQ